MLIDWEHIAGLYTFAAWMMVLALTLFIIAHTVNPVTHVPAHTVPRAAMAR